MRKIGIVRNTVAIFGAFVCLTIAASDANAQATSAGASSQAGQTGGNFAAHKQQILAHIAERIQTLQTLQSCVQNASNHAAVRACRDTARAALKSHN